MSSISTIIPSHANLPRKPASLEIGELAIAASTAGFPLSIYYRDFPPHELCEAWRYHAVGVGAEATLNVANSSSLNRLSKDKLKLIMVREPTLRTKVAWDLNLRHSGNRCAPALFAACSNEIPEDEPGVWFALHPHPGEISAIERFLHKAKTQVPAKTEVAPITTDDFHPAIEQALDKLMRWRDRTAVRRLLIGAAVQNHRIEDGILSVGLEEYRQVHELLQQQVVFSAEEAFDPLAVAMVRRANAYLGFNHTIASQPKLVARIEGDAQLSGGECAPFITRCDLANLGHPRSKEVKALLEYLKHQPDGYKRFQRLGRTKTILEEDWSNCAVDELVEVLLTWSPKQVRTRFTRLCRDGLVEAKRESRNGPWQYRLPHAITDVKSVYRSLPNPNELVDRAEGGEEPSA